MKRLSCLLGVCLIASGVFTACGSSSPPSSKKGGKGGKDLIVMGSLEFSGIDPHGANGQSFWALLINSGNATEGLTRLDGKSPDVKPALATSWEWADSKDTKMTVTLREGVKFHDGTPFDSDAVVKNFDRVLNPDTKTAIADWVEPIKSVKAAGPTTVEITAKRPTPNLPVDLTAVMMIAPSQLSSPKEITGKLIGTGPYMIDSVSPQAITMKKNPGYWGKLDAGAPGKVTVRTSTEAATRVAALESDETQIAFDIPPELASRVPKTVVTPALDMVNWRLNGVSGLTKDVRVRKALVLGTDRELIRKTVVGEKYSAACTGNDVPKGVFGFNPNLPNPPYDPEQAKQLLTEAGAMGKTVQLVGSARYAKSVEGTQALAQQIEKLGLKVKLEIRDTQGWLDVLYAGKKNTVGIVLHGAGSETWDALATYSKGPATGSPISEFPADEFPLFDEYLHQAAVTIDDRQREALLFKVGEQFNSAYAFICGWTPSSVYGAGKDVSWSVRRDNQIEFSTVRVG